MIINILYSAYFEVKVGEHRRELLESLLKFGFHQYLGPFGIQFSSVTQSCLIFCDPMDYSMPGFPVHHQLVWGKASYFKQISQAGVHGS